MSVCAWVCVCVCECVCVWVHEQADIQGPLPQDMGNVRYEDAPFFGGAGVSAGARARGGGIVGERPPRRGRERELLVGGFLERAAGTLPSGAQRRRPSHHPAAGQEDAHGPHPRAAARRVP